VGALISKVLTRAGYQVRTAVSGEEGLTLLEGAEDLACLVVDKILPGMNGLEVMAEARRRRPGLPVVLITGHPEPFQLGDERPEAVLTKPFQSLPALVETVSAAVAVRGAPLTTLKDRVVAAVSELNPSRRRRE
jgi:two-component system cell cycle sensor histidine kinase/response regulator CckA